MHFAASGGSAVAEPSDNGHIGASPCLLLHEDRTEIAPQQGESGDRDSLAQVVIATRVDQRVHVDVIHAPDIDGAAGVVHPYEPVSLELVQAQKDAGHLRLPAMPELTPM